MKETEITEVEPTFASLIVGGRPLSRSIVKFLKNCENFTLCSPVQACVIPVFGGNNDVAVQACTGSGKTLAYIIPVVHRLLLRLEQVHSDDSAGLSLPVGAFEGLTVGAVVIAPTRELVQQIHKVLSTMLEYMHSVGDVGDRGPARKIVSLELFGGRSIGTDKSIVGSRARILASEQGGLAILVSTPGRLRSHLTSDSVLVKDKDWTFRSVEVVVLDEADRLFADTTTTADMMVCLNAMPRQRRTGLFSATLTNDLRNLARTGLRAVKLIRLSIQSGNTESDDLGDANTEVGGHDDANVKHAAPGTLENFYVKVQPTEKFAMLLKILETGAYQKVIVFAATCAMVEFLSACMKDLIVRNSNGLRLNPRFLDQNRSWRVSKLHRHLDGAKRRKNLEDFQECIPAGRRRTHVLFSSDLAARGIDFKDVDLIIQFDAPTDPSACVHRVGRTARAGKGGQSVIFIHPHEEHYVEFLKQKGLTVKDLCTAGDTLLYSSLMATTLPKAPYGDQNKDWYGAWKCPIPGSVAVCDFSVTSPKVVPEGEEATAGDLLSLDESSAVVRYIRWAAARDRKYVELAKEAFVAQVRAYKEHQLDFIFVAKRYDCGLLANSLGLLKVPRVKEILGQKLENFEEEKSIKADDVKFRDVELQRKYESKAASRDTAREERMQHAMQLKKEAMKRKQQQPQTRSAKKKHKREVQEAEWLELQREGKLILEI